MSAREELVDHYAALMYEDWSSSDWHHASTEHQKEFRTLADKRVDDLLHEEAEKIRKDTTLARTVDSQVK